MNFNFFVFIVLFLFNISFAFSFGEVKLVDTTNKINTKPNGVCEYFKIERLKNVGDSISIYVDEDENVLTLKGFDKVSVHESRGYRENGEWKTELTLKEAEYPIYDFNGIEIKGEVKEGRNGEKNYEYSKRVSHIMEDKYKKYDLSFNDNIYKNRKSNSFLNHFSFYENFNIKEDCVGYFEDDGGGIEGVIELEIQEGWNLLPSGTFRDIKDNDHKKFLNRMFFYDVLNNEFLSGKDSLEINKREVQDKYEDIFKLEEEKFEKEYEKIGSNSDMTFSNTKTLFEMGLDFIYKNNNKDLKLSIVKDVPFYSGFPLGPSFFYYSTENDKKYLRVNGYDLERDEEELYFIGLIKGWNFGYVSPILIYDFNFNYDTKLDPLSINDISGDCSVKSAYFFENQNWKKISLDYKFKPEDIGKGMIVKTNNDCRFSFEEKEIEFDMSLPN